MLPGRNQSSVLLAVVVRFGHAINAREGDLAFPFISIHAGSQSTLHIPRAWGVIEIARQLVRVNCRLTRRVVAVNGAIRITGADARSGVFAHRPVVSQYQTVGFSVVAEAIIDITLATCITKGFGPPIARLLITVALAQILLGLIGPTAGVAAQV